jgi:hypothetical protein
VFNPFRQSHISIEWLGETSSGDGYYGILHPKSFDLFSRLLGGTTDVMFRFNRFCMVGDAEKPDPSRSRRPHDFCR